MEILEYFFKFLDDIWSVKIFFYFVLILGFKSYIIFYVIYLCELYSFRK